MSTFPFADEPAYIPCVKAGTACPLGVRLLVRLHADSRELSTACDAKA